MAKINQGLNMIGICKGVKVETRQNPNNASQPYVNEYLGIAISLDDGYGGTTENIQDIPLRGKDGERIKQQVTEAMGKLVSINFAEEARKGNNPPHNAYMNRYLLSNSNLQILA